MLRPGWVLIVPPFLLSRATVGMRPFFEKLSKFLGFIYGAPTSPFSCFYPSSISHFFSCALILLSEMDPKSVIYTLV
jgi:hypothetical protein